MLKDSFISIQFFKAWDKQAKWDMYDIGGWRMELEGMLMKQGKETRKRDRRQQAGENLILSLLFYESMILSSGFMELTQLTVKPFYSFLGNTF